MAGIQTASAPRPAAALKALCRSTRAKASSRKTGVSMSPSFNTRRVADGWKPDRLRATPGRRLEGAVSQYPGEGLFPQDRGFDEPFVQHQEGCRWLETSGFQGRQGGGLVRVRTVDVDPD